MLSVTFGRSLAHSYVDLACDYGLALGQLIFMPNLLGLESILWIYAHRMGFGLCKCKTSTSISCKYKLT